MATPPTPQDPDAAVQEPSAFVRRVPTGERLPMPARSVADWETFRTCLKPVTEALWADAHGRLDAIGTESAEHASELGPLVQRVERAVPGLDGVARVHVSRWGDGAAHLHFRLLARPAGLLQLRGTFLPVWEELLPSLPEEERRRNHRLIAERGGCPRVTPRTARGPGRGSRRRRGRG
ncbi:hypothetical protein [Streptomyces shaanxiensis]